MFKKPFNQICTFAVVLVLLFTSCLSLSAFAADTTGGYIVLVKADDARLFAAAETLAKYLNQITGKEYPVAEQGEGIKFVLDYTADVADNGYIIKTSENEVSIKGSGTRGVIHGVYGFLEKYCGCDWYTRDLVSVPKNENLTLTPNETKYEPFFEYTDTDWYSGDLEYSLANGLSGGVYRDIPVELGGEVGYLGSFAHTLTTQFCSSEKYFAANPEYFALHDGERLSTQLCLTNENVYEIVRDEVLALLRGNHNPDASLQIISLTQADNCEMCMCENCMAVNEKYGDGELPSDISGENYDCNGTGTIISFVNRIARDVKTAGYDNVAIDTFAYRYTRKAPVNLVPEDNVIVRLCTIECCFAHTIDDADCPNNVKFMKDLSDWSKICDRLYVWDYTTNYANTAGLFPDFGVLQRNVQIFLENNVKGIYEEGNYYISNCDAEFGDLRSYLLAKLMQDPYIDYEGAMLEFNNAFYGDAGKYITDFINLTTEKPVPEGEHLMIYVNMKETLGFDKNDIKLADELWDNAKNAIKDDEALLKRVERSELSWRYWKVHQSINFSEIDALIADMNAFGILTLNEGEINPPENLKGLIIKSAYKNIFGFVNIGFYVIVLLLALVVAVFAFRLEPKKWQYLVALTLTVSYYWVFKNHRSLYLEWSDITGWLLSLIGILIYFALLGVLAARGRKSAIIASVVCAVATFVLYEIGTFGINNMIYDGKENVLGISVAYTLLGAFAVALQAVSLKNIIKDYKSLAGK